MPVFLHLLLPLDEKGTSLLAPLKTSTRHLSRFKLVAIWRLHSMIGKALSGRQFFAILDFVRCFFFLWLAAPPVSRRRNHWNCWRFTYLLVSGRSSLLLQFLNRHHCAVGYNSAPSRILLLKWCNSSLALNNGSNSLVCQRRSGGWYFSAVPAIVSKHLLTISFSP